MRKLTICNFKQTTMMRRRSHHIGWLLCPLILLASMISTLKLPSSSLLNHNLYHHDFLYKNSVVLTSKSYSAYMKSIYSYTLLHMNSIQINNNDNSNIYKAIITVGSNVNVIDDDKIQKKKKEFNSFNDGDDSDNDNDNDCSSGRKATSTQRRYNSNYTTTSSSLSSSSSSSYSLNNNNELLNGDTKTIKATGKRFNYTSTSTLTSTNNNDPTRYNNPTRYKDSSRYNSKDISTRSYTYKKTFSAEYKNSKYNPTKHILRNTMKLKTYDNYSSSSTSIASISSLSLLEPSSLFNLTASYSDDSNANVNHKNDDYYIYDNMKYSELISLSFHYAKMNQPVIVINIIKVIIKNNKKIISIKDINNIIKIIVTKGLFHICDEIINILRINKIRLTIITYSTIISRASLYKKINISEKYFNLMLHDGIVPDVQAYNSLINGYAKIGDTKKCLDIYYQMLNCHNVQPTIITFNTLLDSCSRTGNIKQANIIFNLLQNHTSVINNSNNGSKNNDNYNDNSLKPNARTYSTLIHTYCKGGYINEAFELLSTMIELNLQPNAIIYSQLIHGLGSIGKIDEAFHLLYVMKQNNIQPNVVTMSTMIHTCGLHGKLDLAFQIYNQMILSNHSDYQPNSITCSSLIDLTLKNNDIDKAFEVVRYMRDRKLTLNEVTYTSLICELTRLGQVSYDDNNTHDDGDIVIMMTTTIMMMMMMMMSVIMMTTRL